MPDHCVRDVRQELSVRVGLALALVSVACIGVGCKSGPRKAQGGASASAPVAALGSASPGPAPAAAKALAGGGSWQLLRQGKVPGPQPPSFMRASVKVWDTRGKQIFSSSAAKRGILTDLRNLSPALLEVMRVTGVGGMARAWLPPEAMVTWRPSSFPNEDLVYEIEILEEVEAPQNAVRSEAPAGSTVVVGTLDTVAPPDLSGPPKEARTTAAGLRFVVLAPGTGARPGANARLAVLADAWAQKGLTVEKTIQRYAVSLKPSSAPAGLGEVLQQLGVGGRARVWVPAAKAASVFPQHQDQSLVVDLTLDNVESN